MNIFEYDPPYDIVVIVGKGPTMSRVKEINTPHLSVGLNHSVGVDISHQIDWNCIHYSHPFVLTPYYPLLHHRPYNVLSPNLPNVWNYNLYCSPKFPDRSPIIKGDGFSLHYVITIFALLGIKDFLFAGIDGGDKLHSKFQHLKPNPNYDRQFKYVDELKSKYQLRIKKI